MDNKILVTYASRTGSTAETAAAIGKTLGENGAEAVAPCSVNARRNSGCG